MKIKYLVILLIISSCNGNIDKSKKQAIKIDEKNIIQIDTNKKSGIIFTKPSDSLSYENFYFSDFNNALIKMKIKAINYYKPNNNNYIPPSYTIKKTEIFNKCACIQENEKFTIVFSYKSVWFTSEIFLILKGDSVYALKYYSGDISVSVDTLQIKKIYLSKPLTDYVWLYRRIYKINKKIQSRRKPSISRNKWKL